MHRGDTEVQVWQWWLPHPTPNRTKPPTSPRSLLGVICLSVFFLTFNLLTFTSCHRCLSITHLSITVFLFFPSCHKKKIKYLFLLASVLCFPAHSLATHSSFPPFFLLCAFPSYLHVPPLVLSLALILFLFHLFTFSLLHPTLSKQNSLFRYPRPFLSVTSVLSLQPTRIGWILSSMTPPAFPQLGPLLPLFSPPYVRPVSCPSLFVFSHHCILLVLQAPPARFRQPEANLFLHIKRSPANLFGRFLPFEVTQRQKGWRSE